MTILGTLIQSWQPGFPLRARDVYCGAVVLLMGAALPAVTRHPLPRPSARRRSTYPFWLSLLVGTAMFFLATALGIVETLGPVE